MDTRSDADCPVIGLAHVAIKAADLPATIAFYRQVLGLVELPRPPFGFPGAWLGTPDGEALVHLYAGERARNADGSVAVGSAAVDHVSLWARGYEAQRRRFESLGLPYRSQPVPASDLVQLFVYDPNGVMLELTYRRSEEPGAVVGERGGELRFEPQRYAQFAA
jgi:catechol 2,3-dioxygenase-like lactoylglutathione lyase family enzyme